MPQPEYIELSDNDDIVMVSEAPIEKAVERKFPIRPAALALKHLGLSLIKLQYFENIPAYILPEINEENGFKKKDENVWQSIWVNEPKNIYNGQLRHILEQRFNKTYKCEHIRSRFCQNPSKMTRLNWIHHVRRGHVRVNCMFKKILKKNNNNIGAVLEIFCVLCNLNRRMAGMNPQEFVQHMKKYHSQFMPYDEYFAYFKRCFICNDQTRSFHQNVSHRQLCIGALLKDPNQVGTENFNNCFKMQRFMPTYLLEANRNPKISFHLKLKHISNFKTTSLYLWMQLKKNGSTTSVQWLKNGCNPKSAVPLNLSLLTIRRSIESNKQFSNCKLIISDRVAPGSNIDESKIQKFFIPVPFVIKNDWQSKKTYIKWRKSLKPEHSKVQSNRPWYCEICNAMLKNNKSAYCHIKMCHPSAGFHESSCKSCNKRFLTNQGYRSHFHGSKKCSVARKCVVCNMSVSVSDVYEHMNQRHKSEMKSLSELKTCLICRNYFKDLHSHLFDIHGMSNTIQSQPDVGKINYRSGSFFNCTKCSLTYFSEMELRNHMILNDHHLQCEKCPTLKFYLSWELMNHMSVAHKPSATDDKFACDLCSQSATKDESKEKPRFTTPSELVRHFIDAHLTRCSVLLDDVLKKG